MLNIDELKHGDTIRNLGSNEMYIVIAILPRVYAIKTLIHAEGRENIHGRGGEMYTTIYPGLSVRCLTVTNPTEWVCVSVS